MRLSLPKSLARRVNRIARAASLLPNRDDVPQMTALMNSLSEPVGRASRPETLERYRAYLSGGWREGRSPHPLFDEVWYSDRYPDVHAAGFPGLVHYLRHGWREGRSPHPSIPDARLLEHQ